MDGMETTRASLRVLRRLVGGLKVHREALLAAFDPEVFAADRALELAAEGMPFRKAYQKVRAHLDELGDVKPGTAVAGRFGPRPCPT